LSPDGAPVPQRWVEDLFARLTAIAGSAMATVYAGANPELVKREWAEALAGFTAEEVKRGLVACRTRKFAPNLGEFLHLCRPSLDPEIAWLEAERGLKAHGEGESFAWSHPAVFWTAREFAYELRTSSFDRQRKRWESRLAEWFASPIYAAIPDPMAKRLSQQAEMPEVPQRRDEVLAQMRGLRQKMTGFATKADEDAARAVDVEHTDDATAK
jgi:hypothetical protein